MVNACVVFGCSNTSTNLTTLHQFPKEKQFSKFGNNLKIELGFGIKDASK